MNNKIKNEKPKANKQDLIKKISLAINYILIGGILILVASATIFHVFDYAIINKGFDIMCGDNFRNNAYSNRKDDVARKQGIASIDYMCIQNGADTYYEDGQNKYLESLGLPIE